MKKRELLRLGVTTTNTDPVSRRTVYDARVREFVCATGNPRLFPELNIPKSDTPGMDQWRVSDRSWHGIGDSNRD